MCQGKQQQVTTAHRAGSRTYAPASPPPAGRTHTRPQTDAHAPVLTHHTLPCPPSDTHRHPLPCLGRTHRLSHTTCLSHTRTHSSHAQASRRFYLYDAISVPAADWPPRPAPVTPQSRPGQSAGGAGPAAPVTGGGERLGLALCGAGAVPAGRPGGRRSCRLLALGSPGQRAGEARSGPESGLQGEGPLGGARGDTLGAVPGGRLPSGRSGKAGSSDSPPGCRGTLVCPEILSWGMNIIPKTSPAIYNKSRQC